ncbi:hypothetical protein [Mucilaginibacter sp. BT774]|uniref:hypothetical protein n=1 Tax=Mucilaginibacter sp. BT774 TaxID=3062276 RepID=UPI0026765BE2|nr:hypothetical protein [Mucilaginibacter sp. BT774]MDO3627853.1 hypothetical protein [Mucilaginibacter sp. BT774]
MAWLFSFLLVISVVFSYLLFAPFYLEINSTDGLFAVRFHKAASVKLAFIDHSLKIDLKILGWKKQIDLLDEIFKRKPKEKADKKSSKGKAWRPSLTTIKAVIKSFKLNKCYLNIDTGNMQLNGILYPCFYWLNKYTGKPIGINFEDKNEVVVEIQNNCAGIIRAFIYSSLKTKHHGKLR